MSESSYPGIESGANDRAGASDADGVAPPDDGPLIQPVWLDLLRLDGGTQLRAALNPGTVGEYAAAYRVYKAAQEGKAEEDRLDPRIPPPVVFYDCEYYWPADGHQRIAAAKDAGLAMIPCEIHGGTLRDAILYAAGANVSHGDRRTPADARNAVETLLRDPEWGEWSDREIGMKCGVDHKTVAKYRRELTGEFPSQPIRKGADGRTINTARIGRTSGGKAPPSDPEAAVEWGRSNGTIPAGADVAVTIHEGEEPAPAPDAPVSDEEFLETLNHIRDQLTVTTRKIFDASALGYLRLEAERVAFVDRALRPAVAEAAKSIHDSGPYLARFEWACRTPHPSRWKICASCKGKGEVEKGRGACQDCKRNGFHI